MMQQRAPNPQNSVTEIRRDASQPRGASGAVRRASPRAHATMRARATQANSNARVSCPFPAGLPVPRVRLTALTYLEGMNPVALPHASFRASPAASSARPASLAAGLARLTLATPRQVVLRSCLDSHGPRLGGCALQRRPAPSRPVHRCVLCRVFARGPVLRGATRRGRCLWRSLGQVGARIGTPRLSTPARHDSSRNGSLEWGIDACQTRRAAGARADGGQCRLTPAPPHPSPPHATLARRPPISCARQMGHDWNAARSPSAPV